MSVGFPSPGGLMINGHTAGSTESKTIAMTSEIDKAVKDSDEADSKDGKVRTGGGSAEAAGGAQESSGDGHSVAVKTLQKRMKELQQQLRELQQQLEAAQKASYPSEDARTSVLMGIQGQISTVNGALMTTAAALLQALTKEAKSGSSGSLVSTTA
ncbi:MULTISPECIES: hypothetical protein [Pseudomonas]|uniref:hypothetical protein n=1 Tax=Pseudomonas TaxID=286 RepID=UPI0006CC52F5|nr:hypothetical protein [Pseudomonas fuscovaginae]KPA98277.1 hypothetical protein PF70_01682 [Pseudomonas fuscovaginae]